VAVAYQTHCDRCGTELARDAAYCAKCGERTHRARRLVRLAVRVEILLVLLVTAMIIGFAFVFYRQ